MLQTIIGGNGTIGSEVARKLCSMDIPLRIASRTPWKVNSSDQLFQMDVFSEESVLQGIKGSTVVYLILGLPYSDKIWLEGFPKAVRNVINACKKEGSRLVYFDNVYMYGKVEGWMKEDYQSDPASVKGTARMMAADLILDEINRNTIQAMICRSADFYGDYPPYDAIKKIAEALQKGKKPWLLYRDDKKHSLTYIPDAAGAVAFLAQQAEAYQRIWHMPTDPDALTGKELVELIARILGKKPEYKILNSGMIKFLSLFNPQLRELTKLSYQWENDYLFSSEKLEKAFGLKAVSYENGIHRHLQKLGIIR